MAVKDLVDVYLRDQRDSGRLMDTTLKTYSEHLGIFARWHDGRIVRVSRASIRAFLDSFKGSSATPASYWRSVRPFARWLVARGLVDESELAGFRPRFAAVLPRTPPEPMQILRIVGSVGGGSLAISRDRMLFLILYFCGLRIGEAVAIRMEDIRSGERPAMTVRGKGDKPRIVPIPPVIRPRFAVWLAQMHASGSSWLFPALSPKGGHILPRHVATNTAYQAFRKACKAAGLSGSAWPHGLRHACAKTLLSSDVQLHVVGKLLGHTRLATTLEIYGHLDTGPVERAVERVFSVDSSKDK